MEFILINCITFFTYRKTQTLGSLTVCRKIKLWQKGLETIWSKQREISQYGQRPAAGDVTFQCLQFCCATPGMSLGDLKCFYIHLQRVMSSSYVCNLFQDFSARDWFSFLKYLRQKSMVIQTLPTFLFLFFRKRKKKSTNPNKTPAKSPKPRNQK